jgi:site-specific DNA-cytosine methylase
LTPVECLRLQAMPDDHLDLEPPLSDSAKYRLCGNSGVANCLTFIGLRLRKAIEEAENG